jgi:hypothetical protein
MSTERGGGVGAECNTRSAKGEKEISWYHKRHDSSIFTRAFFIHQREVPSAYHHWVYSGRKLLFLQEQIKHIIIIIHPEEATEIMKFK